MAAPRRPRKGKTGRDNEQISKAQLPNHDLKKSGAGFAYVAAIVLFGLCFTERPVNRHH